jgi:hypothetical protein
MFVNYDRNTFIVQVTCGYTLFMCKLKITKLYIFICWGFCNFILLTSSSLKFLGVGDTKFAELIYTLFSVCTRTHIHTHTHTHTHTYGLGIRYKV